MENGKKGVRGSNFAARGSKLVVFHFGNKLVSVFSACERDGTEKNGVFSMFNVGFGGNFGQICGILDQNLDKKLYGARGKPYKISSDVANLQSRGV